MIFKLLILFTFTLLYFFIFLLLIYNQNYNQNSYKMIKLYISLFISILILIFIYLFIQFKEDLENFENIHFSNQWDISTWQINGDQTYNFWICMKPLIHKILDDTFQKCDLVKNVENPIIHFRCADTPFIKQDGYHFQYYTFFKNSLEKISTKLNKKYDKVDIMSCSFHRSGKEQQDSCGIYAKSIKEYLKTIEYESNIICNSNIDDFASLFYAPAVISTHSSFSFMSGFFGKGMFISTEFHEGKQCENCDDSILYGYNLLHNQVDDYNNTDTVVDLLKQK